MTIQSLRIKLENMWWALKGGELWPWRPEALPAGGKPSQSQRQSEFFACWVLFAPVREKAEKCICLQGQSWKIQPFVVLNNITAKFSSNLNLIDVSEEMKKHCRSLIFQHTAGCLSFSKLIQSITGYSILKVLQVYCDPKNTSELDSVATLPSHPPGIL